jgi:hypothetical protein
MSFLTIQTTLAFNKVYPPMFFSQKFGNLFLKISCFLWRFSSLLQVQGGGERGLKNLTPDFSFHHNFNLFSIK